jgi:putative ABC transport system permease protein
VNHLGLATRNLARRPVRSSLTALGVAFAVGSFIALYGLSNSVYENAQESLDERGSHLAVSRRGRAELFGGSIGEQIGARIASIPGVRRVTGELIALAATAADNHVLAAGWPEDSYFWSGVPLAAGRQRAPGERKVALVGDGVAESLKAEIGSTISLMGEQFRVIGIARYRSVINRNSVIVPLTDLQEAMFRPGVVTLFHVQLEKPTDPVEVDRVRAAIEADGMLSVSTAETLLRNDRLLGLLRAVSSAMAWVALLMGMLMVLNTLLMAVIERTREIGIMSAIGWSPARIMGVLIMEGLVLSATGSAIGALLGVFGSQLLSAVPAIGRYVAIRPTFGLIAATAVAAVALGVIGAFYPAWVATRQDPAAALDRP